MKLFDSLDSLIVRHQSQSRRKQADVGPSQESMAKALAYTSLDQTKKEIRILDVCQDIGDNDRVICHFAQVSLLSAPVLEYEALSWHWGDALEEKEIELSGRLFPIRRNAEEVLRRVCVDHGHRFVWLDAVCINQQDKEERNYQISIMADIYSKAARTVVWLGDDEYWLPSAIKSIYLILEQIRQETDGLETAVDHLYGGHDGSNTAFQRISSSQPLPPCDWNAISRFFSAPWFSRLWTVQEVELAESVLFYRGEYRLAAEGLWLVGKWLTHRVYQRQQYDHASAFGITRFWWMFAIPETACQLLPMFTMFQVTNPYDKIYALIGLIERSNSPEFVATFIRPDYDKPLHSVYTAAARMFIHSRVEHRESGLGQLLSFIGRLNPQGENDTPVPSLPSWVPSFNFNFDLNNLEQRAFIEPRSGEVGDGLSAVIANSCDPESPVLRLQGLHVDTVNTNISSKFESLRSGRTSAGALAVLYCSVWAGMMRQLPDNASLKTKYALTLVEGSTIPGAFSDLDPQGEADVTSRFQLLVDEITSKGSDSFLRRSQTESYEADDALPDRIKWILSAISLRANGRALFVTKKGYIGMGPQCIKQNDAVSILFGGFSPFALRREGDRWSLLGDIYLYDLMDVSHHIINPC